eukprot:Nk52_evm6s331 gene=Nk52_evmTU6s331
MGGRRGGKGGEGSRGVGWGRKRRRNSRRIDYELEIMKLAVVLFSVLCLLFVAVCESDASPARARGGLYVDEGKELRVEVEGRSGIREEINVLGRHDSTGESEGGLVGEEMWLVQGLQGRRGVRPRRSVDQGVEGYTNGSPYSRLLATGSPPALCTDNSTSSCSGHGLCLERAYELPVSTPVSSGVSGSGGRASVAGGGAVFNVSSVCVCEAGWLGASDCSLCGGRRVVTGLTAGTSGVVSSSTQSSKSGSGLSYTFEQNCTWVLVSDGAAKMAISLTLEYFNTECGWDFVYIRDGPNADSPLVAVLTGDQNKLEGGSSSSSSNVASSLLLSPATRTVHTYSGAAHVFFFSDRSVQRDGFNISYRADPCPGNCNGNGVCGGVGGANNDRRCVCDASWTGEDCSIQRCPVVSTQAGVCGGSLGYGSCSGTVNKCICAAGRAGNGCQYNVKDGYFAQKFLDNIAGSVSTHIPIRGRAWQSLVMNVDAASLKSVPKFFYVFGGYAGDASNGFGELVQITELAQPNRFDYSWKILYSASVSSLSGPGPRWRHTAVMYGDNVMYIFGGTDGKNTLGELWTYTPLNNQWNRLADSPIPVQGHTANVVDDTMVIIHGYNEERGETTAVQIYDFGNNTWTEFEPQALGMGSPLGSIGHTSTYVAELRQIVVIGGGSMSSRGFSTRNSYAYNVDKRTWNSLSGEIPFAIVYHSAVLIGDVIVVFGGNTDNVDGVGSCFSNKVFLYNFHCDSWKTASTTGGLFMGISGRRGHSAVWNLASAQQGSQSFFMFGGHDGQFQNDMMEFVTPTCGDFSTEQDCLSSGMELCSWCSSGNGKCIISGSEVCSGNVKNSFCSYSPQTNFTKTFLATPMRTCSQMRSCYQCETATSTPDQQCEWGIGSTLGVCVNSIKQSGECKAAQCSSLSGCDACLQSDKCVWCQGLNQCMDSDAFLSMNQLGGCTTYRAKVATNTCPASFCGQYTDCNQCIGDPLCGWCDDGSGTGKGQCMEGTYSNPTNGTCNGGLLSWKYETCPECQCNGHSQCDKTMNCLSCADNTQGFTCDSCATGYYGSPQNGGSCTVCATEFNGHSCSFCDSITGGCTGCADNTTGASCEKCKTNYWGDASNGGKCQPCDLNCNGHSNRCDASNGECSCPFGYSGKNCELCDSRFIGEAANGGLCYYQLGNNVRYHFADSFTSLLAIFIPNSDDEADVQFSLSVSPDAAPGRTVKVSVAVTQAIGPPFESGRTVYTEIISAEENSVSEIFSDGNLGGYGVRSSYFLVNVTGSTTGPLGFSIMFVQDPVPLDLIQFFITFFACFFLLLGLAFGMWKLRQWWIRRHVTLRHAMQMKVLANRPTGRVVMLPKKVQQAGYTSGSVAADVAGNNACAASPPPEPPTPIGIEYLDDGQRAVVSVLVDLPTRAGMVRRVCIGSYMSQMKHPYSTSGKGEKRFSLLSKKSHNES